MPQANDRREGVRESVVTFMFVNRLDSYISVSMNISHGGSTGRVRLFAAGAPSICPNLETR